MKSKNIFFDLLTFFIFCAPNYACTQQNVVLGKSYKYSAQPNYKLTVDPADQSQLTDGKKSGIKTVFWTQKTTVGWQNNKYVQITFDLNKSLPINSIRFSTAEGKNSDVYFPKGIYAYLSNDNLHFYYQGKLSLNSKITADHNDLRGLYLLENIKKQARFVVLCIYPDGINKFLFCDEVTIMGSSIGKLLQGENFSAGQMKDNSNLLLQKDLKVNAATTNKFSLPKQQSQSQSALQSNKRLQVLGAKFSQPIIAEKTENWGVIPINYLPSNGSNDITFTKKLLIGGSFYGSFSLTNTKNEMKILNANIKNNDLKLYKIANIGSKNGNYIADPLLPIAHSDTLYPGQSQEYLVIINNIKKSGLWSCNFAIDNNPINIDISIQLINNEGLGFLNAVNWGYLNYPMLSDVKSTAISDMELHHINTFVIQTSAIPKLNSTNFTVFKNYLNYLPKNSNILLFMDYSVLSNKTGQKGIPFLSAQWKSAFISWYNRIISTMTSMGFKASNVYLYPYDEVRKNVDIMDFKKMLDWVKLNNPNIRFFATITNKTAADALFNYLDIAQFYVESGLIDKYKNTHTQKWTYSILGTSRSLPPYTYYRLMAWKAYKNVVTGIGFWNYAGNKQKTYISSSFQNYPQDYTVVYNTPDENSLISSRRWEAFKEGMDDYRVIKLFEKKFGRPKALELVNKVLSDVGNNELAEQIIQIMLSKIK